MHEVQRVTSFDDPNRCQAGGRMGQCPMVKTPNSNYCPRHSGSLTEIRLAKKDTELYKLSVYKDRLAQFSTGDGVIGLRNEIGIMRILIEEMVNQIQGPNDVIIYSAKIGDLISKLNRLVTDAHKLEATLSSTIDASKLNQICDGIGEIIAPLLTPDQLSSVAARIGLLIERVQNAPTV